MALIPTLLESSAHSERRLNTLEGARILVIGAGGAARAAVFGLKERGSEVYILNRTAGPAKKLAHQAHARLIKRPDLKKLAFDVIINATPVGMGNTRETPLQENEINARYVFDMIYDPPETRLLEAGQGARRPDHPRDRNVRSPGSPPVRNLDRQTRPLGRDAARGSARTAGADQPLGGG